MIRCLLLTVLLAQPAPTDRQAVLVVVGAPGEEQYGSQFGTWAERWRRGAEAGHAEFAVIGLDSAPEGNDADRLRSRLEQTAPSTEPLWLVLIGHGTFDGQLARFNLRGPDVSAEQLGEWLKPIERPVVVINCASSSSPFINRLSGPDRVIVTATKSGQQYNFARFGDYLSAAISDASADLDKDDQTSLLEAFLYASAKVAEFYEQDGRLATEHALLDDTGDALGTPADWFRGVRAVKAAKDGAPLDGRRANQICLVRSPREQLLPPEVRARRDELELEVARLRDEKTRLAEDDYYGKLEPLLVELARLYETAAAPEPGPAPPADAPEPAPATDP